MSIMDARQAEIASFVRRFRYRSERRNKWTLLDGPGLVHGDCEDFALTVAWLACGRSRWRFVWAVLTFGVVFWHARVNGEGHMMLRVRGCGWIDNNYPQWSDAPAYRPAYPLWVLVFLKLLK